MSTASPSPIIRAFEQCRHHTIALTALLIVAIAIPSPHTPWFNGIPLSVLPELLTISFALAWSTIPVDRIAWGRYLSLSMAALALIGIALKLILLLAPPTGFQACYQVLSPPINANVLEGLYRSTVLKPLLNNGCEKSYDAPFASDYSRYDAVVNFGQIATDVTASIGLQNSNWNISAVNSLPFAYAPETDSELDRDRLPFSVQWRGNLEQESERVVRYVGEGTLTIGGLTLELPPSYQRTNTVALPASASGEVILDYQWINFPTSASDQAHAVYGEVHLETTDETPLGSKQISLWPQLLGLAVFVALGAAIAVQLFGAFGFLLSTRLKALRKGDVWVFPVSLAIAVGLIVPMWRLRGISGQTILTISTLIGLLLISLVVDRYCSRFLAFLVIPPLAIASAGHWVRDLSSLTYRTAMDDFLVYESYAREILVHGDLRGGEDIFIYSPAIRYLLYAQHMLFGDGDKSIFVVSLIGLLGSSWFAVDYLVVRRLRTLRGRLSERKLAVVLSVACVTVVGLLYGSSEMKVGGLVLLSEYPTWILLTVAFPLVFFGKDSKSAAAASTLLALALTFRGNQLPGIGVMLLFLVVRQAWPRIKSRHLVGSVKALAWIFVPFFAISALPGIHNLYFGGQLVLLQTSIGSSFMLTPASLLHVGTNSWVSQAWLFQLEGVLVTERVLNEIVTDSFIATIRLIQVGVAITTLLGILHFFRHSWRATLLNLVPLAFLVTHLFVQVDVYYPRHIMVGYAIGSLTLLALAGVLLDRGGWKISPDPIVADASYSPQHTATC